MSKSKICLKLCHKSKILGIFTQTLHNSGRVQGLFHKKRLFKQYHTKKTQSLSSKRNLNNSILEKHPVLRPYKPTQQSNNVIHNQSRMIGTVSHSTPSETLGAPKHSSPFSPTTTPSQPKQIKTLSALIQYRNDIISSQNHKIAEFHTNNLSHLSPIQLKLLPFARFLALSAKGLVVAVGGVVSYHVLLNFIIWSRYVYDHCKIYHPELIFWDTKNGKGKVDFLKLISAVTYLVEIISTSVKYYRPTLHDVYYEVFIRLYLPLQKFRFGKLFGLSGVKSNSDTVLTKNDDKNESGNQGNNRIVRTCTLTGNELDDVLNVQKYCSENLDIIQDNCRQLESLLRTVEMIYYSSFYNMKNLHHEIEKKKFLYQFIQILRNNVKNNFDENNGENFDPSFYTNQEYYLTPNNSITTSPISIDNSYLKNTHIFDHILSGGHFYDKFSKFHFLGLETNGMDRINTNIQNYLYQIYSHFSNKLPLYKLKNNQGQNEANLGLHWDFNIRSHFDILSSSNPNSHHNSQHNSQNSSQPHSMNRHIDMVSLSIHQNGNELSHTTLTKDLLEKIAPNIKSSSSTPANNPQNHNLTPETILHHLPLPDNIAEIVYGILSKELSTNTNPVDINKVLTAMTLYNNSTNSNDDNITPSLNPNDDNLYNKSKNELKSILESLRADNLSPVPTLQAFSMDQKIELQEGLYGIIQELKRIIIIQHQLHTVPLIPVDVLKEYQAYRDEFGVEFTLSGDDKNIENNENNENNQNNQNNENNEKKSFSSKLDKFQTLDKEISQYYQSSLAHLTYNIALCDKTTKLVEQFTSFLSPLYIISHPLYFQIARHQYCPDLTQSLDRFVLNMEPDGSLQFGQVKLPYIGELNYIDCKYLAKHAPLAQSTLQQGVYELAVEYTNNDKSVLYQYHQEQFNMGVVNDGVDGNIKRNNFMKGNYDTNANNNNDNNDNNNNNEKGHFLKQKSLEMYNYQNNHANINNHVGLSSVGNFVQKIYQQGIGRVHSELENMSFSV